jgi:CheY-like chemotaxis protein
VVRGSGSPVTGEGKRVLVSGDDRAVAGIVREILEAEGWRVAVLTDTATEPVRAAVDRLEPDGIRLAGAGRGDDGPSRLAAAALHARARPIPVIMFTAAQRAADAAPAGVAARRVGAAFAAVLPKPFALVATVAAVVGGAGPDREAVRRRPARRGDPPPQSSRLLR